MIAAIISISGLDNFIAQYLDGDYTSPENLGNAINGRYPKMYSQPRKLGQLNDVTLIVI